MSTAVKAAMEAGRFLQKRINDVDLKIEYKKKDDPVTAMDREAEKMIIAAIKESYPDHSFLGEESGESGLKGSSDYKWIIDPIDGTKNFIKKEDGFSVSIGVEYKKELIVGVIYAPMLDLLFTAEKGKGAFCNGERIRVSDMKEKEKARILVTTGYCSDKEFGTKVREAMFREFPLSFNLFKAEYFETFGWTNGSAALELAYLAKGEIDAVVNFGQKPWDIAAGIVVLREACGVITDLDGKEQSMKNEEVVAGNAVLHKMILGIIGR